MKYLDYAITFREFLNEIALCINITNCSFHFKGCHSPELWEDIGTELTIQELSKLINSNKGITCIGFMGGIPEDINTFACYVYFEHKLKVGWYWGGNYLPDDIKDKLFYFDYIKLGPYIMERGGLDNPNTNQRFYHVKDGVLVDWTYKFWKHGNNQ